MYIKLNQTEFNALEKISQGSVLEGKQIACTEGDLNPSERNIADCFVDFGLVSKVADTYSCNVDMDDFDENSDPNFGHGKSRPNYTIEIASE